jgi:hypothetical protein
MPTIPTQRINAVTAMTRKMVRKARKTFWEMEIRI